MLYLDVANGSIQEGQHSTNAEKIFLMNSQLMRPFTSEFEALWNGTAETKIVSNL